MELAPDISEAPIEDVNSPSDYVPIDVSPPLPDVPASVFANPQDIERYKQALANGASEQEALKVGDNGRGAWGDDTTSKTDPIVALSPNTPGFAYNRRVIVTGPNGQVVARIADKGPEGRLDLNPAAAAAVGHPGGVVPVTWKYADTPAAPQTFPDIRSPQDLAAVGGAPSNKLTPIGSGIPELDISSGQSDSPDTSSDAPEDSGRSYGAGGVVFTDATPPDPADAKVVSENGPVKTFDNGATFDTSTGLMTWKGPEGRTYVKTSPDAKPMLLPIKATPHPIMVGGLPYQMQNGELVPVPVKGQSDVSATATNPFEGLSDGEKAQAQAILDYRSPLTSRQLSSPNPQIQKILQRIYLSDPNFDVAKYDVNKATLKDYSPAGKDGQNILSLNQTINHLGHLEEVSDKVGGTRFQALNSALQAGEKQIGVNPALRSYGVTSEALEQELSKLLKGGMATEGEVKAWREQLGPSQSPDYRSQAFKDIITLLGGRLDALKGNYEAQIGKPLPNGGVLPEAKKVLARHGWSFDSPDATDPVASHPATPAFEEGKIYRDAKGNTAKYVNGQWVPQ